MKPAAMKDGKLYSQQPHSGAGDFNFSRADGVQTRINKHGLIETVANNEPRLSYDLVDGKVSDCPHLLLEPSRTNDMQRSEEFDNSYWTKYDTSVSENQVVSPDGSVTADKLIEDTGASTHQMGRAFSFTSGSYYVVSVFVKENGRNFQIRAGNINTWRGQAIYNLSTGSVQSTTYGTASIENYGNGWYRCMLVGQALATSTTNINFGLISGTSTTSYTGDGLSGVYLWGAQREVGLYATSYIPTSGSTKTRQVELCNGSGNSETFNDIESSLFLDIEAPYEDLVNRYITISDGGSSPYSNYLVLQYRSNGTMRIFHNGIDFADAIHIGASSFDQTARHKIAIRFKEGDMKVYVDGVSQSINGSFVYQSVSGLNEIKFNLVGSSTEFHGKVHELSTFKEPLIDSELQLITTP